MLISVKMAMRNLLRHKRRTAFTVGLACVAATAAITSIGYMSATFYAVAENTIRGGIGHMQIAKTAQFEGLEDYPLEHGLSIADVAAIETALAEISPGAEILPRIEFQGVASAGDESLVFIGTALDPMAERALTSTGRRVIDGVGLEHTDPSNPYQVLIGKELARLLDVSVGESLTLMTPTTFGGLNAADVEIVGIASLGVAEVDRTYIAAPIALAQDLLRTEHVGKLAIALPDEVPVAETLARFKGTAPAGVTAKHWRELASLYDQLIEIFSSQFSLFGLVIAVMIVLTLLNTVAMSVLERRKESATMMSMGFQRGYVRRLYTMEGGLIGAVGAALGIVVSLSLIWFTNTSQIVMPPPPGSTEGYILILFAEPVAMAWTAAAIIVLALVSAWFASGAVRQSNIMESVRHA